MDDRFYRTPELELKRRGFVELAWQKGRIFLLQKVRGGFFAKQISRPEEAGWGGGGTSNQQEVSISGGG